jgi:hypothetical protein
VSVTRENARRASKVYRVDEFRAESEGHKVGGAFTCLGEEAHLKPRLESSSFPIAGSLFQRLFKARKRRVMQPILRAAQLTNGDAITVSFGCSLYMIAGIFYSGDTSGRILHQTDEPRITADNGLLAFNACI